MMQDSVEDALRRVESSLQNVTTLNITTNAEDMHKLETACPELANLTIFTFVPATSIIRVLQAHVRRPEATLEAAPSTRLFRL